MPVSEQDIDNMTRTVMGEAGDQSDQGKAAVAHVIMNRVQQGKWGDNPSAVVHAPGQFEPWQTRRRELHGYDPKSLAYQQTRSIVEGVLDGSIGDPTNGATHFYSPVSQAALGRRPPGWSGSPKLAEIGGHRFYAPEGAVVEGPDDLLARYNKGTGKAPAAATGAPAGDQEPVEHPDDLLARYNTKPAPSPSAAKPDAGPVAGQTPNQRVASVFEEGEGKGRPFPEGERAQDAANRFKYWDKHPEAAVADLGTLLSIAAPGINKAGSVAGGVAGSGALAVIKHLIHAAEIGGAVGVGESLFKGDAGETVRKLLEISGGH